MKKRNYFLPFVLLAIAAMCLTGCVKDDSVLVSTQDLRFGLEAESQTMIVKANCKWKVSKNDDADWYTISPMSGRARDSVITVTVNDYSGGDFRGSSFVIISPGGHIRRTVFVSQNKLDFDGMINKIFGVMARERWDEDYYGQIIEETYKYKTYDPYDTTRGYLMYFLEDGKGVQRDHHNDTAVYYDFTYEYNDVDQILHVEFETVIDTVEAYDAHVLTASDSLYRFIHEFLPMQWERADMRKIGVFNPDEKAALMQKVRKRKGNGPIFLD